MADLFAFDYQLECYVPAAKRKYGYFVLPVLWQGKFAARMDCKVDRTSQSLNVLSLSLEPHVKRADVFFQCMEKELSAFMRFNGCSRLELHKKVRNAYPGLSDFQ